MSEIKTDYSDGNNISQNQYTPPENTSQSQPVSMLKRIGSTTYRVKVHFSESSHETVDDKISRLIQYEAEKRRNFRHEAICETCKRGGHGPPLLWYTKGTANEPVASRRS